MHATAFCACGSDQPAAPSQNDDQRFSVTLRKPMGMVLAEGKSGEVHQQHHAAAAHHESSTEHHVDGRRMG